MTIAGAHEELYNGVKQQLVLMSTPWQPNAGRLRSFTLRCSRLPLAAIDCSPGVGACAGYNSDLPS